MVFSLPAFRTSRRVSYLFIEDTDKDNEGDKNNNPNDGQPPKSKGMSSARRQLLLSGTL